MRNSAPDSESAASWGERVVTVHRLNCLNVKRDGFVGESVAGIDQSGNVVVTFLSWGSPPGENPSDPARRLLVLSQPLRDASSLLIAGFALHEAHEVIYSGTHMLPGVATSGPLPTVCTIGARRSTDETVTRTATIHTYSPDNITIDDDKPSTLDGVGSLRQAHVKQLQRWVSSLLPGLDVKH